jgi:NADPH:quinone reductase-like Zn-dependent oxidoreductase
MKAIMHERYGGPEVLRVADLPIPTPGEHDVLVKVHAAAVNARDWHLLRGDPYLARLAAPELGLRGPKVAVRGTDFAGTVEAVGPGVTRFRPGDEVYGEANAAFADYVCAPESVMAAKPRNLAFARAAAIPLAANTALMGLRGIHSGQRVLINGASGGVGTFAVQIAKAYGADVTAVCSRRNVELVSGLGADRVIDYSTEDFSKSGQRYDVVFDLVGNRTLTELRRCLTRTGTLVLSGGGVSEGGSLFGPMGLMMRGKAVGPFLRQRVFLLEAKPSADNLATLTGLVEAGQLVPVLDRTYPLEQAADAIRYLEVEHARAKVVLVLVE